MDDSPKVVQTGVPVWLRTIVFQTSIVYADALLKGKSVQEAEWARQRQLEQSYKLYGGIITSWIEERKGGQRAL